ncbi:MAG: T9SS type A sorting domain-containing protein [Bacteroidetes bacterium]|nr:T9SS type A sorting domain-containing protein [Bacteroidota bacterium]
MNNLKTGLAIAFFFLVLVSANAQTYTSSTDGAFSTGSNWAGGTAPPLSGQSFGSVTVQNNMNTSGSYTVGSFALSVSSGKTFTINGNLTLSNSGGTIDVYGTLIVTGTLTASANPGSFFVHPGGQVIIQGAATINNNAVIKIGTNAAPPPYADMVFESNVALASGGAGMTVNQNGRVAVYGNLTSSTGGGQSLTINNGGQMYVNGNVAFTGGGDQITNNNSTSPFGLYVNGTTTNTGGGATTTSNKGTKADMLSGDPSFYSWVASQPGSPLPVTLTEFKIGTQNANSIQVLWTTASELNFDYFELEKSVNNTEFTKIAQVAGHGTTKVQHEYSFTDQDPMIGSNFYRLKAVDVDGHTETFNVIVANFAAQKDISVYPNPLTNGNLHINLNFETGAATAVTISDTFGATKASATFTESNVIFPITLDPGVYVITIVNESYKEVKRLVINR